MRQMRFGAAAALAALGVFYGCSEQRVTGPEAPDRSLNASVARRDTIPGQYIITFRDDVAAPVELAQRLAALHGLTLRHTYQYTIKGFSAVVPEGQLAALRANPLIQGIYPNEYMHIDTWRPLEQPVGSEAFTVLGLFGPMVAPAPPAPPSNLTTNPVSTSEIDLTWQDNSTNETGFKIERGPSSTGPFTEIAQVGANVTSYNNTGLSSGTQYCYRVRAFRIRGSNTDFSTYSNVSCSTTQSPPPPSPPAAPSNTSAKPANSTTVNVTWTDNSNNEDGFRVERSTDGGTTWGSAGTTGPNVTSFSDGGRTSEAQVCYRVFAFNSVGDSPASNTSCTTPPAGPTNLTATKVDNQAIDLAWTDNSAVEDGYEVQRSTAGAGGPFSVIANLAANSMTYRDTGLSGSTTYWYEVRAKKDGGFSDFSNVANATTDPNPPGTCTDNGIHDDLSQLWGIRKVKANLNAKWKVANQDCGKITVDFFGLDTGVDSGHVDLHVVEMKNFVAAEPGSTGRDGNGHGTHTAGTAAAIDGNGGVVGVAPGAPIHGFRVCNNSGSCAIDDIIAGIDQVTGRKNANPAQPMVANMSLGGSPNDPLDTAVRRSENAGVVYTISAGNGFLNLCSIFDRQDAQTVSPARTGDDAINASNGSNGDTQRINGIITTTSSDSLDQDAHCNYGNPVTVAAPGVGIKSTWLNNGYNTISGTSMAAPHSAGAAMIYLQDHRSATPTAVEQAIVNVLDPWTPTATPNASGRLNVQPL